MPLMQCKFRQTCKASRLKKSKESSLYSLESWFPFSVNIETSRVQSRTLGKHHNSSCFYTASFCLWAGSQYQTTCCRAVKVMTPKTEIELCIKVEGSRSGISRGKWGSSPSWHGWRVVAVFKYQVSSLFAFQKSQITKYNRV